MSTKEPKSFRDQFIECRSNGDSFPGEEETHHVLLPLKNGETSFTGRVFQCGKFGGTCSTGNGGCRALRGTPA